MTSVFEQSYVKKLTATHAKTGKSKMDLAEQVIADIEGLQDRNQLRPAGHGLVRIDRGLSQPGAGARNRWPPSKRGWTKATPRSRPRRSTPMPR